MSVRGCVHEERPEHPNVRQNGRGDAGLPLRILQATCLGVLKVRNYLYICVRELTIVNTFEEYTFAGRMQVPMSAMYVHAIRTYRMARTYIHADMPAALRGTRGYLKRIYRLRNTLNGNRPSWSFDPGPAQPPSGG